jgi:RNA methyltransferase, TrmH family
MIMSAQNPRVKQVRLLQAKARARHQQGRIVLEGARLVQDALAQGLEPDFILHTAAVTEFAGLLVSEAVMAAMSATQQPQGVIGVFPLPAAQLAASANRVLILDAIRDPGNLGTILRTAAAAGVEAVLLAPGCADPYNPKVLRAGMGAHFRVPLAALAWPEIVSYCADMPVYFADSAGVQRYDQVDWTGRWGLIIGNEAHGPGQAATHLATGSVSIPLAAATESLNAALAAGIILFEAQRQRL